jgi:hypothetical protein
MKPLTNPSALCVCGRYSSDDRFLGLPAARVTAFHADRMWA